MLGQKQYGSISTFFEQAVVDWTWRTSLFDLIVICIVRAIAISLVLWRWRTQKSAALPLIGIVATLTTVVYGITKMYFVFATPNSVVMVVPFVATFVPVCFILAGALVSGIAIFTHARLSSRSVRPSYEPLPVVLDDDYDSDSDLVEPLAGSISSINNTNQQLTSIALGGGEVANKKKKKPHTSVGRIAALLIPETPLMVMAMLCLFVSAAAVLVVPYFFGQIIGAITNGQHQTMMDNIFYLIGCTFVGGVAVYFRSLGFVLAGQRLVARLRIDFYRCLLKQDVTFYDREKVGGVVNRITTDTQVLQDTLTSSMSTLLRNLVTVVGSIIILFVTSWRLTLVMMATVPVITVGAVLYGQYIKRMQQKFQDHLAASTAIASESLAAIRTLRSFTREKRSELMFTDTILDSYETGAKISVAWGLFQGCISILSQGAIVLVIWYGSTLIFAGQMGLAELISFMLYSITIAASVAMLSTVFGTVMQAVGASQRVFELMDRTVRIPISGGLAPPENGEGVVRFEGVTFAYPTRKKVNVLQDMSFEVPPSKITALVGKSGSGKSTCVALIERFYDPQSGRITLDGVDIRDLDPQLFRKKIGYVTQEPTLFSTTIRENILFGIDDPESVSDERLHAAGRLANCHDFIMEFEKGYDTQVGEKGVQLSGGQRQRVAVARALIINPRILLLDEATAALDAESEHLVTQAIERAMEGRTTIVIAHRLSTIRNAHQLLVLENGRIVERGTHDSLIAASGVYADLVKRQMSDTNGFIAE